jgi:hypothetical protein
MADLDDVITNNDSSDSDDDVLGLVKPIDSSRDGRLSSGDHMRQMVPSQPWMIPKNNQSGWLSQRRSRRFHHGPNHSSDHSVGKWTKQPEKKQSCSPRQPEMETFIPSMETIEAGPSSFSSLVTLSSLSSLNKGEKLNRYQRMREVHDVTGFIVNVHDAINFDIDLEISPDLHEKYGDVVSNQYTYQDLGSDFLENPDLSKTTQLVPKIGTTYRCRLRGVGMNQLPQHLHTWKTNQMCVEVKQLIDRTDGWITCTLSDIDVYKRLLVDVVIHTCREKINLRDHLLARMREEKDPIFYPYSGKKERNFRYEGPRHY